MSAIGRLQCAFIRWGLLKHPYGREYAREHYTLSGKFVPGDEVRGSCEN